MQANTKLTKYKQNERQHPTYQIQIECKPTSNLPHTKRKSLQYKYNASQHPTYQLEIEYEPTLKVTNMNRMQANPKLPNTNRIQANTQLTKDKQNARQHPTHQIEIECKRTPNLPNTNRMQANIHISIAVRPSAFGEFVVMLLKMLMRTRKMVMRSAILPDKEDMLTLDVIFPYLG